MGLRGIDAKPLSERTLDPSRGNPWDAPGCGSTLAARDKRTLNAQVAFFHF
jgi:hypothetical protein